MENKCLVTTLKGKTGNNSLPIYGTLMLNLTDIKQGTGSLNKSVYSIAQYVSPNNGQAKIVSEGTNVHFEDGSAIADMSGIVNVMFNGGGENFTLLLSDKYNIKSIRIPNADRNFEVNKVKDTTLKCYSKLESFIMYGGELDLSNFEVPEGLKVLELDNLDNIVNISNTIFPSGMTSLKLMGLNFEGTLNIHDNTDWHTMTDLNIGSIGTTELIKNISFDFKKLCSALSYNNNGICAMANMGQAFNQRFKDVTNREITAVPKNVFYINLPVKQPFTCELGQRNSSDCSILAIGGNRASCFYSHKDVDNFFINNSTCTFNSDSNKTEMHINALEPRYSPSGDAQNAIKILYQKGITAIYVNGISMETYRN